MSATGCGTVQIRPSTWAKHQCDLGSWPKGSTSSAQALLLDLVGLAFVT